MKALISDLFWLVVLPLVCGFAACGQDADPTDKEMAATVHTHAATATDSLPPSTAVDGTTTHTPEPEPLAEPPMPEPIATPEGWLDPTLLDSTIVLDIRYATDNNFMEEKIYDCGRCWLRPKVARALVAAQADLREQGLGFKMYDCYRPAPYQQRLWDKVPDPRYVADPARGSVHSRGAAVDLTLIDLGTGKELEMGTPYDFFGEAAYTTTTDLPAEVLQNRKTLQNALLAHGFRTIRTEWWHFNFAGPRFPLSEDLWSCPH